jgi:hypothetical protein
VELAGTMQQSHDGRLPDGLQVATTGPLDWKTASSWLEAANVVFADAARVSPELCRDTLLFAAFLARNGGADGEKVGSRLMLLALPNCARLQPPPELVDATWEQRAFVAEALPPMLTGFAIDGQVRRFGSWLSAGELASLPAPSRALAEKAPPPPFNPLERNTRAAIWSRAFAYQSAFSLGTFEIDAAVKEWPERVSDPKLLRQAYDEEQARRAATELVLDAWKMKLHCALGTGATSSVKPDGEDCLLSNQNLHVQLPSRKE